LSAPHQLGFGHHGHIQPYALSEPTPDLKGQQRGRDDQRATGYTKRPEGNASGIPSDGYFGSIHDANSLLRGTFATAQSRAFGDFPLHFDSQACLLSIVVSHVLARDPILW
jgi:hypothetical protein